MGLKLLLILGCSLLCCGCGFEYQEYTIHMKYGGDTVIRRIICPENTPRWKHDELRQLYTTRIDLRTYEGLFEEVLPGDVGGFGRNLHLVNAMGHVYLYVERFQGTDIHASEIQRAFDTIDHLVDLAVEWLQFELGSHSKFEKLKCFCEEELRSDLKNLTMYLWVGRTADDCREKDWAVRILLYLYERKYFTLDDVAVFMASTDREAMALPYLRRLIGRQLECDPSSRELTFLKSTNAVKASVLRFFRSSNMSSQVVCHARTASDNPERVIDPNSTDYDRYVQLHLNTYDIELDTFALGLDLFSSVYAVHVCLEVPRRPCETNGEWDEGNKEVRWTGQTTDDKLPLVFHAIVGDPNEIFQKRHFGTTVLADEELLQYSLWYSGLDAKRKKEWDHFLGSLEPTEDIVRRVATFRFTDVAGQAVEWYGGSGEVSLVPCTLILEGLRKNRGEH